METMTIFDFGVLALILESTGILLREDSGGGVLSGGLTSTSFLIASADSCLCIYGSLISDLVLIPEPVSSVISSISESELNCIERQFSMEILGNSASSSSSA